MPTHSIEAGITANGYRNTVKDYNEQAVVEELAANSYDEDATTVLVLLNVATNELHIVDDGHGFTETGIQLAATLGGGDKAQRPFSLNKRPHLGSYGVGLKSTLNTSSSISIHTTSKGGTFTANINWDNLDEVLRTGKGYSYTKKPKRAKTGTGSIITLSLKNPTDPGHLEGYGAVLGNLPTDNGGFLCYYGDYSTTASEYRQFRKTFSGLKRMAKKLEKLGHITKASNLKETELADCEKLSIQEKDPVFGYKGVIYFSGMNGNKTKPLKKALRGIFVRINGRLLKHDFSERKYTYNISKYMQFASGLRVELEIDWLRTEVTLARDGINFKNEQLEKVFTTSVQKTVNKFIKPKLKLIAQRERRKENKVLRTRLARVTQRLKKDPGILVKGLTKGYRYLPESDAELAILIAAQPQLIKQIGPYELLDFNESDSFDCLFHDTTRGDLIQVELEPTLEQFLNHNRKEGIELIVTWRRGNWKPEVGRNGKPGYLLLTKEPNSGPGRYTLIEFPSSKSKRPRARYPVAVLEEML